ncbi:MAG: DUF6544 family protein [Candidatus Nanopelagicales bacterium]
MRAAANRAAGVVVGGLAVGAGLGWLGLQVRPANLPVPTGPPAALGFVDPPTDVPAPVARFYRAAYGDRVPRVTSMAAYGRARARFGLWMPLRFRLVHQPGQAFERSMEVTWFGRTVLRARDRYVDGRGMTGPVGKEATGPAVDQGANLILWAEAPLMPSLWITDDRLRWEPIDDTSAQLNFPFGAARDALTVHFDARSDLITRITALRHRDRGSGPIPWQADFLTWAQVTGAKVPARISITWPDQGGPWSTWDFEHVLWNRDIGDLLPAR